MIGSKYPVWLLSLTLLACLAPTLLCAEPTSDYHEPPIADADRQHWSFLPITRPALPEVADATGWCRTSVDRFILAKLESKQIPPTAEAGRETLLRRLTFDLTGLPPRLDEIEAFTSDQAADAYERQVDRLLASPTLGERWGQHWLDLARFAQTDGYEHDLVRKQAWRYRDWVIAALNADLPYDKFVRQQLAGDERDPRDSQESADELLEAPAGDFQSEISDGQNKPAQPLPVRSIPTMFTLAGPDMPDINSQEQRQHDLLNEVTSTVGSVFLGLQVGCAQCHDHKYDPLSQADFYRLRAFFEPAVHLQKDVSVSVLENRPAAKTPAARLWLRGDWQRPGPELSAAFPRIANPTGLSVQPTDLRSQLARWIASSDNPLASRVIVNRIWQSHWGRGLCDSPSDLGILGSAPTHPELLDALASDLPAAGWSLKKLHRQIVNSAAYRQGAGTPAGEARDPRNELYSRSPRRRLDGEALRDALLSATGLLNLQRGGPGVMPPLPSELTKTLLSGQWQESPREADHYRRGIYLFARRNLRYPIFEAFDRPDANASCSARSRSTTAPQALLLINSDFSLTCARHLAGRVLAEAPASQPEQIAAALRPLWSRSPTPAEQQLLADFLTRQSQLIRQEGKPAAELPLPIPLPADIDTASASALVDLCLALLNANETLYVD